MIRQPGGSLGPSDNWLMPAVGWALPHSAGDTRVGAGTQGLPAQSGHGTVAAVRVRVAMRAGEGRSTSRGLFAEFQHQLLPGISRHSQTANRSAAEVQGSNLKLSRERSRTPSPGGPDAAAKAMRARYPSRAGMAADPGMRTITGEELSSIPEAIRTGSPNRDRVTKTTSMSAGDGRTATAWPPWPRCGDRADSGVATWCGRWPDRSGHR